MNNKITSFNKHIIQPDVRVLAAGALILEFIFDVITVATGHHWQLRMCHSSFSSIQFPEAPVAIPYTINQPGCSMTHFMNESVPEAICEGDGEINSNINKEKILQTYSHNPSLPLA